MIKSPRELQGPLPGGSSWAACPAPVRPGARSRGCTAGLGVPGMSGAWGVERARCQAALAVLASLCRARPPPVGLDVQTCRSFELQTPERRPSAADAGNAKAEAPPFLDRHPNCPPPPSVPNPLAREHRLRQCPGPWPAGQAARSQGAPGGEDPLPAPV